MILIAMVDGVEHCTKLNVVEPQVWLSLRAWFSMLIAWSIHCALAFQFLLVSSTKDIDYAAYLSMDDCLSSIGDTILSTKLATRREWG